MPVGEFPLEQSAMNVRLIVGDGSLGLPVAGQAVFPESRFQICLWHLCQALMRQIKSLNWVQGQQLYHDFRETFNALTLDECYEHYLRFQKNGVGMTKPWNASSLDNIPIDKAKNKD